MATITDIKRRIQELAPAQFQELCDTLISKNGYGAVHGYGMKAGSGNTTIGNPDTYFRKKNGKYVFVVYSIQQTNIFSKLKEDIIKCFDSTKTGLNISEIEEIICCHTSSNLSAGKDKELHEYCENQRISLTVWGIDEIANQIYNRYRSITKDFLGLSIDTNQILSVEDFITLCDANGMSAPLNTIFRYREKEKEEIIKGLKTGTVLIITGKAGVGKTRLVLEAVRTFATVENYNLLCVKNNNLSLYDDLVASTEKPGKYLFFVDDANELAELNLILGYTTKKQYGYTVKIIVTVRDYAKSKVIESVREFASTRVIEIFQFSDEQIKVFLNDNLKIRNENYVKHIIRIAEGNPRIAYMAGKLAVEEQNLSAIKDVSELYDAYYKKYVDSTFGEDRDLCFTAGVLSVINAVILKKLSVLQELLDTYGISNDKFKEKIFQLSRLEVVEIELDQVAILTDQCLANFMLYYVFLQRKIVPLSKVLEIGYKYFRNGVIRAMTTILNLFGSEETTTYCTEEILDAWDNLNREKHPCYENFVKDFHVFRPETAFIMAQQKIKSINKEEFNVYKVDFSQNIVDPNESILEFLSGYKNSDHLDYVMELLLDYVSMTSKTMVSGYKWLKNCYGIGILDDKYKYYTQRKISIFLLEAVSKEDSVAMAIGFQWAKYSLAFLFNPVETGREKTILHYFLELKHSEDLGEYRRKCWEIVAFLATKAEWKERIMLFLEEYSIGLAREPDRGIVSNEVDCIEQLLSILKCNRIRFLKVVKGLITNAAKVGVKYNQKWSEVFIGKEWALYQLLEYDFVSARLEYEEYKNNRNLKLAEYGNKLSILDVQTLVQDVNSILSDIGIENNLFHINQGLELILQQFDEFRLKEFFNAFIQFGDNISIHPCVVLDSLNRKDDSNILLSIIKENVFPKQNEWMFGFFETLPESKINFEMLKEFLVFLENDSDKEITSSAYRNLRVLDKFLIVEPNIYSVASSMIYEKRDYNRFIVCIYFEKLFHEQINSPKDLLILYRSNISLLQDIYFFMLKQSDFVDFNGVFLIEFLSLDEIWLQRYSEIFWEHVEKYNTPNRCRNNALWKSNEFIKYFDYILYHFLEEGMYRWQIGFAFKDMLTYIEDNVVKQHQKEWIMHIVTENAFTQWIDIIFEFICELDDDIKRSAIQTFLDNNPNFETFDKLSIVPNHWSGKGSEGFVPAYQEQIGFLESLYPIVSGIKFLRHREKIKSEVEQLRDRIKQEKVAVICRNLYM